MRYIIINLFLILNIDLFSQLKIDAGEDKAYNYGDTITLCPVFKHGDTLGGYPTAKNGTPPYKYKWEIKDSSRFISLGTRTASYYLNDTTIANPLLIKKNILFDTLIIILTVKDSNNLIAKDTLIFYKIQFKSYSLIGSKYPLDTVDGCSGTGGTRSLPYTYSWIPNKFISDTSLKCPKFWPPYDLTYYCQISDRFGCKSGYLSSIIIKIMDSTHVNISNSELVNFIQNFQNPINETTIFDINKTILNNKIELYNNMGQLIHSQKPTDKLEVGKLTKEKGLYYIVMYDKGNKICSLKLLRE